MSVRPTLAGNGARIVLRSMIARILAISATATSRSARARSTSIVATAWFRLARSTRSSSVSASAAWASRARSSASSTETSRATSRSPSSTTAPGLSRTRSTSPATSFLRLTERRASTVPIAAVVSRCLCSRATATAIDSMGSGWLAARAAFASISRCFHAASPAAPSRIPPVSAPDPIHPRRFIGVSPRCPWGRASLARRPCAPCGGIRPGISARAHRRAHPSSC